MVRYVCAEPVTWDSLGWKSTVLFICLNNVTVYACCANLTMACPGIAYIRVCGGTSQHGARWTKLECLVRLTYIVGLVVNGVVNNNVGML